MHHRLPSLLLLGALAAGAAADEPAGAVLRFATACAQCHEGECSGRLSFARRPQAAFDHIRQYAGPTDDALAMALYAALERMKRDCDYAPITTPALEGALDAVQIEAYRDPWSGAYFIPLPMLSPARYRLRLETTHSGRARVEIIDVAFDPLFDQCIAIADDGVTLTLDLGEPAARYLRLRPRDALRITRLALTPVR